MNTNKALQRVYLQVMIYAMYLSVMYICYQLK